MGGLFAANGQHCQEAALEILVEIALQALAWLLELACEIGLQIAGEMFANFFGHKVKARAIKQSPSNAAVPIPVWLAVPGHLLAGAVMGYASIWLLPQLFIATPALRIVNVLVSPLLAGAAMAWMGMLRRKENKIMTRLDTFAYAYCFAFAMAVVRYFLGH